MDGGQEWDIRFCGLSTEVAKGHECRMSWVAAKHPCNPGVMDVSECGGRAFRKHEHRVKIEEIFIGLFWQQVTMDALSDLKSNNAQVHAVTYVQVPSHLTI